MNAHLNTLSGPGTIELFELEEEPFEQARRLARQCPIKHKQWAIYSQSLALSAFTEWLEYRAPSLKANTENSSVYQTDYAQLIDAVSFLSIGEFRICLLPKLSINSTDWILPRAVLDIPAMAAHLYVVMGIDEDASVAAIQGFIPHSQLQTITANTKPDADWNYALPICELNEDPDNLLLTLDCLEPAPIVCPVLQCDRPIQREQLAEKIAAQQAQPHDHPWTWEELVAILTDPPLRTWVYQQTSGQRLETSLQPLKQTLIDVGQWFTTQAEAVCEELMWQLLPHTPNPAFRFEGAFGDLVDNLLNEIKRTEKLDLPQSSVRACTDITRTQSNLKLYGITWTTETQWYLVLVLGATPDHDAALGTRMQVSDQATVLWDESLQPPKDYLYVQLSAQFNEVLTVLVTPPEGEASTYLFTYRPSDHE